MILVISKGPEPDENAMQEAPKADNISYGEEQTADDGRNKESGKQ